MAKLPKALIRKYGISKKAWSVFKGSKSKKKRSGNMARRRMSKGRRGKSKGFGGISSALMGAGGVVLYESLVSPRLPLGSGITKNAIEFGIGYALRNKGGFLGATGKALMTVNAVEVVRGLLGGGSIVSTASVDNF